MLVPIEFRGEDFKMWAPLCTHGRFSIDRNEDLREILDRMGELG